MPEDSPIPDRRRLKRAVPFKKDSAGTYSTHDSMYQLRKVGSRKWERGVRQPQHGDGEYDFKSDPARYQRLRDGQESVEASETIRPRKKTMQTDYHDRRGQ